MSLLTEVEAKTKWCPLARVVETDDAGEPVQGWPVGNHASDASYAHPRARCIGSACMAWRTATETDQGIERPDPSWRRHPSVKEIWERTVGYCGAFGRPE